MAKKIPGLWFHSEEERLNEILLARTGGLLGQPDEERAKEIAEKQAREDFAKLLMLASHYGIEPGEGTIRELALALARELYPKPKKRGPKSKWTPFIKAALVVEIERSSGKKKGVDWAANNLAKKEPWRSFLARKDTVTTSPDPGEALRQVYYEAKDGLWVKVARDAYRYDEYMGTVSEWESLINDAVRNSKPE